MGLVGHSDRCALSTDQVGVISTSVISLVYHIFLVGTLKTSPLALGATQYCQYSCPTMQYDSRVSSSYLLITVGRPWEATISLLTPMD